MVVRRHVVLVMAVQHLAVQHRLRGVLLLLILLINLGEVELIFQVICVLFFVVTFDARATCEPSHSMSTGNRKNPYNTCI